MIHGKLRTLSDDYNSGKFVSTTVAPNSKAALRRKAVILTSTGFNTALRNMSTFGRCVSISKLVFSRRPANDVTKSFKVQDTPINFHIREYKQLTKGLRFHKAKNLQGTNTCRVLMPPQRISTIIWKSY